MAKKNKKIIRAIVLVVVAVIVWFFYNLAGNLLRPVAVNQIRQMTGARVDIKEVGFRLSGRITIRGIRIGPSEIHSPDNAILKAETVDAYFSPWSFFKLSPKLKRLRISDFVVNAQFNADVKEWNILALKLPAGKKGQLIPELRFKRGEIKFSQVRQKQEVETISCKTKGGYARVTADNGEVIFSVVEDQAETETVNKILVKLQQKDSIEISIDGRLPRLDLNLFGSKCNIKSFHSDIIIDNNTVTFGQSTVAIGPKTVIDVNGIVRDYKTNPAFVFGVKMRELNIFREPKDNSFAYGSRIFESFIPLLQVFFDNFSPEGLLGLDVILTGNAKEIAKTHCNGYLDLKDVAIQYYEFPYSVQHMAGKIDVTERSMRMNNIKAAHGKVDIAMNGYCKDFGPAMDSNIILTSNNMLLDEELYAALLPNHKKLWYLFSPNGMVSGDFIYAAVPPGKRIFRLRGDLLDVSIICHYFPYPISGITGKIEVDGGYIELKDVLSRQSGGTIQMNGKIRDANTAEPRYDFNISAKNVAIDNKLIAAFPAEQRKSFSIFDIKARGDADVEIHSTDNNQVPIDYLAKLNIYGDYLKTPQLPEPLRKISLNADLTPQAFIIKKFAADFNSSKISVDGTVWPASETEQAGYCVNLKAADLMLDSNLVGPLVGEKSAQLLKDFQFDGEVNVDAVVGKNSRIKCPELEIAVECNDNSAYLSKFDLPLDNICGKVIIHSDNIEFASLTAVPIVDDMNKPGQIILNGNLKVDDGEVSWASLNLKGTDISFDPRFTAFLGSAEAYYTKLQPLGKMDISLDRIIYDKTDTGQKFIKINGTSLFKGCSIGQTKLFTDIYALLHIDTQYDIGVGMKECKLMLDVECLSFKHRSFENLKLRIPYDINSPDIIINDFVGDCLGGRIAGNAFFISDKKGGFGDYNIDIAIVGVSSEKFVSPDAVEKSGGSLNGEFRVQGNLQKPDDARGRLSLQANGLQLSAKSLVTNIRTAILEAINKDLAFDNVKLQGVVKGKVVEISKMDIYGPTASLRGSGTYEPEADLLHIDFAAYSAAGKDNPALFDNLTSGLGAAFLKVYVRGSLDKPVVKVEALPIFKQSLEILGTKQK
ncbi:MAG: hypothetical protein A2Y12_18995 [Planctomycetes bacterium GWF2_42_9]|nr:MAG: hypothetical protein A2Y12_18995 [Planctomycetes bacterium GWF2_42_9]HAL44461.1 hypothetical protein [Phycisphaerales bacterium]